MKLVNSLDLSSDTKLYIKKETITDGLKMLQAKHCDGFRLDVENIILFYFLQFYLSIDCF